MNSRKLLKDLSANAVQTGVTQVAALVIFYIISRYISKENFGDYNWSTAVGSTIIAIASLGLDLVFVKRVASGQDVKVMTGIHFFHTLFTGLLLTGVLLGLQLVLPNLLQYHALFPLVFFNLVIANIANSFKFCLTGLEEFRLLALVSICTNLLKLAVVIGLFIAGRFDIRLIVTGFLAVSVVEFLISYYFVSRRISHQVRPVFIVIEYRRFIYESLPQLGVVLFDSALARVDWILLGVMSTSAVTAEYSFAYKFFELSKLPLLILAPVLLTRFSRLYQKDEPLNGQTAGNIRNLFRLEMFIALLIPVFMICAWTPLIDYVTDNKYGAVNQVNFTILAFCIPLHYVINFLWTMGFVQGQLKLIMYITIGVSVFNLLANMLLIPRYGSLGAAIAFLAGTLIQFTAYLLLIRQDRLKLNLKPVLVSYFNGLVALGIVYYTGIPAFAAAFLALGIYLLLSLLTGQVSPAMFRNLTKATPHS